MSDIVWSVNPQNDSMQKVVERLTLFATETLETVGISLKVSIGDGVTHLNLPMAKRKEFYMIVKEAVTNCAQHNRAKNAHIVLEKENGHLIFQLRDDGVGLPGDLTTIKKVSNRVIPDGSRPGFGGNGLKNMAARATAIGGDLTVTSEPGGGTVVWLSVPLG